MGSDKGSYNLFTFVFPKIYIKGASENRRLFDRKIRLLELDDFGDSNANWNANGRKKCAVSET